MTEPKQAGSAKRARRKDQQRKAREAQKNNSAKRARRKNKNQRCALVEAIGIEPTT